MLKDTLKDLTIEDIYEEVFVIAKKTDNDDIKLHALSTLGLYLKDKDFQKKMLES